MTTQGRTSRIGAWTVICFLLLPITVVLPISLTDQDFLSLPVDHLSLQYYHKLFASAEWLSSIWQSLVIALWATIIAVIAGSLCAIGC
jgi:putative spermidine/putrescine transport system permease protein